MIRAMPIDTATWGEFDPAVFARIVVVSPHFDDAAMGAGHLLASYPDTTVITVLAVRPPAYPDEPSEWDALGGFKPGDDVVAARRLEDVAAMEVLESDYRWLEFADHQYLAPADRPTPDDVAPTLAVGHRRDRSHGRLLPHGPGQPRPRDGARRRRCWREPSNPTGPGSATRTTATSTSPGCWPGGWPSCCARTPGRRRPSCRTCPTRSASARPSGATPARSRRWRTSTPSRRAWTATSPSSSGTWPRRRSGWEGLAELI